MVEYATAFGVDGASEQKHGHPVCLWDGDQVLHTQNALLAGEAACVVDPLTAEGIPSLYLDRGKSRLKQSGKALNGETTALAGYTQTIAAELGSEMKLASRLAKAFYAAPPAKLPSNFDSAISDAGNAQGFYR